MWVTPPTLYESAGVVCRSPRAHRHSDLPHLRFKVISEPRKTSAGVTGGLDDGMGASAVE